MTKVRRPARRLILRVLMLIALVADVIKHIIYFYVDKPYLNFLPYPKLRDAIQLPIELHRIQYCRIVKDKYYH